MKRCIILASGPSLDDEDIDVCRKSRWNVITINNTWARYPDCDIIYGGDYIWWKEHHKLIKSNAEFWSCNQHASLSFNLNYHQVPPGTYNSGMRAIELAVKLGAEHVILLGYDCSLSHGSHWHGNHDTTANPTDELITLWKQHFSHVAKKLNHKVNIVNCSRFTELDVFRRASLCDTLASVSK